MEPTRKFYTICLLQPILTASRTQANNKRNNRNSEIMLHNIELLSTIASLKSKDFKYPKEDIDDMWEAVLLCQFHDCLPGSSIEMCYDDSDEVREMTRFEIYTQY